LVGGWFGLGGGIYGIVWLNDLGIWGLGWRGKARAKTQRNGSEAGSRVEFAWSGRPSKSADVFSRLDLSRAAFTRKKKRKGGRRT